MDFYDHPKPHIEKQLQKMTRTVKRLSININDTEFEKSTNNLLEKLT